MKALLRSRKLGRPVNPIRVGESTTQPLDRPDSDLWRRRIIKPAAGPMLGNCDACERVALQDAKRRERPGQAPDLGLDHRFVVSLTRSPAAALACACEGRTCGADRMLKS